MLDMWPWCEGFAVGLLFLCFGVVIYGVRASVYSNTISHVKVGGISPTKLILASLGTSLGLGNLTWVAEEVRETGVGILPWIWITVLVGATIKYAEIYWSIYFRRENIGGPFIFLQYVKWGRGMALIFSGAMMLYSIENYQFHKMSQQLPSYCFPIAILATIIPVFMGVQFLVGIASVLTSFFLLTYLGIFCAVICLYWNNMGVFLHLMIQEAFGPQWYLYLLAGFSTAIYSGDIAIGYDGILQSYSSENNPNRQALMSILALLGDSFVCTITGILLGISNIQDVEGVFSSILPECLGFLFPVVVLVLAYTTITGYLLVGSLVSQQYLNGKYYFMGLAVIIFALSGNNSMVEGLPKLYMEILSKILIVVNCSGIIYLSLFHRRRQC